MIQRGIAGGMWEAQEAQVVHTMSTSKYPLSETDFHKTIYSANTWKSILCEPGITKNEKTTKTMALCVDLKCLSKHLLSNSLMLYREIADFAHVDSIIYKKPTKAKNHDFTIIYIYIFY